eukprot:gene8139-biopygen21124
MVVVGASTVHIYTVFGKFTKGDIFSSGLVSAQGPVSSAVGWGVSSRGANAHSYLMCICPKPLFFWGEQIECCRGPRGGCGPGAGPTMSFEQMGADRTRAVSLPPKPPPREPSGVTGAARLPRIPDIPEILWECSFTGAGRSVYGGLSI